MEQERKYQFSWDLLGDIVLGRPNLGPQIRLEVYRLMQFCFRDVMEEHLGTQKTDQLFHEAGKLAGSEFYTHVLDHITDFDEFVKELQANLKDMGIGILRIEKADVEQGSFVLTVSEDLDCSGLPELDYEICIYDEGFIAALMEGFTGKPFKVKEIDCWCTGDRTCRFSAQLISSDQEEI
jgi:predicted hydrocarbon binding protein